MADDPKRPPTEGSAQTGAPGDTPPGKPASPLLSRLQALNAARAQTNKTILGMPAVVPGAPPIPSARGQSATSPAPVTASPTARTAPPSPRPRTAPLPPPMPSSSAAPPAAAPGPAPAVPAPVAAAPPVAPAAAAPVAPAAAVPVTSSPGDTNPFGSPTVVDKPFDSITAVEPLKPPSSAGDLAARPSLPLHALPSGEFRAPQVDPLTSPRTLVEPTPAPLPPSPAAADAEVWFEEAPTRPSALSDIAPSLPGAAVGRTRSPVPGVVERIRPSSASTPSGIEPASDIVDTSAPRPVGAGEPPAPDGFAPQPTGTELVGFGAMTARPRWMTALMIAAAMAVGMALGALLFRSRASGGGDGGGEAQPVLAPCPPGPAPATSAATTAGGAAAGAGAAGATPSASGAATAADAGPTVAAATPPDAAPAEDDEPAREAAGLGLGACVVRVESSPAGAAVTIDDRPAGRTPTSVTGAPCDEPIAIVVEKDRFEPWVRKLTLAAGADAPKVFAQLKRPKVKLEVVSTPAGAVVTIGGRPAGKTPLTTEIFAWVKTTVAISMAGYKPFEDSVLLRPGKPGRVSAALEKEPPKRPTPVTPPKKR